MNRTLTTLRKSRGKSAAALAEQAGSKEMRIYAFERDRYPPRRDEAIRIAAALGAEAWQIWPELFGQGDAQ